MSTYIPRVSIGLPVYNGERYLAQAIDSLLAQTFQDFELIISDNGSSDATEAICKTYAERDSRVRYYRNPYNMGVAANFTRVFELSRGDYFKWASHDDLWAPEFLARSVEVLEARSEVVLAHPRMSIIDENGQIVERYGISLKTDVASPHVRFHELIRTAHFLTQIHGLIRASVLRMTPLIGDFTSSDVPLVARLGLLGRIYEIPEYLVFYRHHAHQSIRLKRRERAVWFNAANSTKIVFPEWRILYELWQCVQQVPLSWPERAWCSLYVLCWPAWQRHWRQMGKDVLIASNEVVGASAQLVRSRAALK